ncbi:MAG: hypothetical protein WBL72_16230, partial [Thermoguttaceae bacterium]
MYSVTTGVFVSNDGRVVTAKSLSRKDMDNAAKQAAEYDLQDARKLANDLRREPTPRELLTRTVRHPDLRSREQKTVVREPQARSAEQFLTDAIADLEHNPGGDPAGGWQVLRDLGYNLTDTTFLRPGSDKEKSGDFTTSKDGVPLAVVYSSGMKPLEVKKAYNQFTVLQYLKHGGSKGKALAEIEAQGFGAERIPFATLKEWVETRTSTNWLVDKMWVAGQPGLIAGEEKTLKTYTAMELAIALASDSMKERPSWCYTRCSSRFYSPKAQPGGPRDVIPRNRPTSQA